jgi:hypothetical protein
VTPWNVIQWYLPFKTPPIRGHLSFKDTSENLLALVH